MLTGSMMQQHRMWQSWYWTGVERRSIDEYPVALWWLFDSVRCALLFWFQASSYFLKQLVKIPTRTRTNTLHTIYCIIVIKCRISGNTRKSKAKQEGSQKKIGFIYHGLDLCYWTHWKLAAFSILIQNKPSLVGWNCKRRCECHHGWWCDVRWMAVQKRQRRDAQRTAPVCEKRSAGEWPLAVRVALICMRS